MALEAYDKAGDKLARAQRIAEQVGRPLRRSHEDASAPANARYGDVPARETAADDDEKHDERKPPEVAEVSAASESKLHAAGVERARRSAARALVAVNNRLGESTDAEVLELAGVDPDARRPGWFRRIGQRVRT